MANDDDHYTLSPESVFVKAPAAPKTLSTRIDEFYLGLLRVFILGVLALTLVGALALGYQALAALNEQARPYTSPAQESPGEKFVAQVKREVAGNGKPGAGSEAKPADIKGDALENQLSRQYAIVSEFVLPLSKGGISPAAFKDRQRALAEELVVSGVVMDPVAYARRQADFLERVLKDKSTVEYARQKTEQSPAYVDEFVSRVLDYYPNLVRDERRAKLNFEHEERERLADARAHSLHQLFAAAGLFVAFLIVCLIVVLIKIERNLRIRGDVIQVVS